MGNEQDLGSTDWATEIEHTRARLDDKLGTLGYETRESFGHLSSAWSKSIDNIKEKLTLRYQTEQHPWPMVGASVATGAVIGSMLRTINASPPISTLEEPARPIPATLPADTKSRLHSLRNALADEFGGELKQLRAFAIGAVIGILRDFAKQSLSPKAEPKFTDVVDRTTRVLGGTRL